MSSLNSLLTPDLIVAHVRDITPDLLRARGLQAVVSDLDNTLVPWRSEQVAHEITEWLLHLRAAGIGVCIASNTRHLSRLERLAAQLGILHVLKTLPNHGGEACEPRWACLAVRQARPPWSATNSSPTCSPATAWA
jgi:HAD superfamily phosphatase (TIGR01668 family)